MVIIYYYNTRQLIRSSKDVKMILPEGGFFMMDNLMVLN